MKRLTFKEFVELQEKETKELERLVRSIHKRPGESVPDNFIHMALNSIEKHGEYSTPYGVAIKEIKEPYEYIYNCDDEQDLKDMKDMGVEIIEQNGMNLIIKSYISKYEAVYSSDNLLADVVTAQEASELLGITEGAIRKAIAQGRLVLGRDYRKAGRITLIKRDSLKTFEK